MYMVTIDSGTTNTRVTVWEKDEPVSRSFRGIGARNTAISGNNQLLKAAVKESVEEALSTAEISFEQVSAVLASGMITSNVGLVEVPHLTVPVGIQELGRGLVQAVISEVLEQPIWFVPGIKKSVSEISLANIEGMDMMRGEEAEVFGILDRLNIKGPALFVLPGSHSKYVSVDSQSRITGCLTTLSGELVSAITGHTILAGTLNNELAEAIHEELLLEGARCAEQVGLGRACFMVRLLDTFTTKNRNEKASFLLGAVLASDLSAIRNSRTLNFTNKVPIYIVGSNISKQALGLLLKSDIGVTNSILEIPSRVSRDSAGYGVIAAARTRGIL